MKSVFFNSGVGRYFSVVCEKIREIESERLRREEGAPCIFEVVRLYLRGEFLERERIFYPL
ncbi:hypothetical protein COLO4_22932 [Corchorus olitorius]|uniref:Uncharacterized protein n=1 Tax=Corchorus olitorius TaxID=93759 RepID=A0A1R3IJ06_9ROSI|nr:hypothetical protein COLO4_22932 [Corchorus olitorius]